MGDSAKVADNIDAETGSESDIVVIHATASLVNSPCRKGDIACQNLIFKVMDSKDHLKRNIVKGKVEQIRSKQDAGGKFKHEIDMLIHVRTSSLWEPQGLTYRSI